MVLGGLPEVKTLLSTSQKKWSQPGGYLKQNPRWREWLCKGPGVEMCLPFPGTAMAGRRELGDGSHVAEKPDQKDADPRGALWDLFRVS